MIIRRLSKNQLDLKHLTIILVLYREIFEKLAVRLDWNATIEIIENENGSEIDRT